MTDIRAQVFGYYGHQNAGDDAFMGFFEKALGPNLRYLPGAAMGEVATRMIMGGGAVINEYFLQRLPHFETLDIVGCSFPDGDWDVARLCDMSDRLGMVALRSKRDAAVARANGIDAVDIPDLVFALDRPTSTVNVEALRALGNLPTMGGTNDRTVMFFLSDHYTPRTAGSPETLWPIETMKQELAKAFDALSNSWNVVTVPMSVWYNANDHVLAADIIARTEHPYKITAIDRYLGPQKILEMAASADRIVSMKFHGLVFGALCGKSIINIGDTRKNVDLMDEIGLAASLESSVVTCDRLLELIDAPGDVEKISAYAEEARLRLVPVTEALRNLYPAKEVDPDSMPA